MAVVASRASAAAAGAAPEITLRPVLPVAPGQVLAARVVAADDGRLELALAGGRLAAASDLPLEAGSTVRLEVTAADDAGVVLRLLPEVPAAAPDATGGALVADPEGDLPPTAARALGAALRALVPGLPPGDLARLAARAADAGVRTPAQAAAFVRLLAAGLPAAPALVSGLAQLAEGAPLGRALAGLAAALPVPPSEIPSGAPVPTAGATAPAVPPPPGGDPGEPRGTARMPTAGSPHPAAAPPAAALAGLVARIAAEAVAGDGEGLARAHARLGASPYAHPGEATLRDLLTALAAAPGTDAHVARAAERTADAVAAQPALPPALSPAADPLQAGAYMQLPLPGGRTAEVRVMPDGGEGGGAEREGRPTRLAFLLHMDALGPLVVEASVSPAGVDAVVRTAAPAAREFLAGRTPELADGLARALPDSPRPRVGVEPLAGPPPRIAPGPPATGLDLSA